MCTQECERCVLKNVKGVHPMNGVYTKVSPVSCLGVEAAGVKRATVSYTLMFNLILFAAD